MSDTTVSKDELVMGARNELERLRRKLVPPHMRDQVRRGDSRPLYRVNKPDYDRLPIGTFLIQTTMGTEGRHFEEVARVVQPNEPEKYPPKKRSIAGRLLYVCWRNGMAVRLLKDVNSQIYRHLVLPHDRGFELLDAFKIGCDTKRALAGDRSPFPDTLLFKALGVEPLPGEALDMLDRVRLAARDRLT